MSDAALKEQYKASFTAEWEAMQSKLDRLKARVRASSSRGTMTYEEATAYINKRFYKRDSVFTHQEK